LAMANFLVPHQILERLQYQVLQAHPQRSHQLQVVFKYSGLLPLMTVEVL